MRCFLSMALFAFGLTLVSAPAAAAKKPRVAFPRVTGPKPAGRGATAKGVMQGLSEGGVEGVRGDPLRGAAEVLGLDIDDPKVAQAADCPWLLDVVLAKKGRGFVARAKLIRSFDGEVLDERELPYPTGKRATPNGRTLGLQIAELILRLESKAAEPEPAPPVRQPRAAAPEPAPSRREERRTVPETAPEPEPEPEPVREAPVATPTPSRRRAPDPEPVARADASASARTERPSKTDDDAPEYRVLRLSLGAGSRVRSAYSVQVDSVTTGLSYALDPLLATSIRAVIQVPGLGLGFEGSFGYAPVSFALSTNPPLEVTDPSGQMIDAGGHASWRIVLAGLGDEGALWLTPLVGVSYAATLVESQGENTVVAEWSALDLGAGLRLAALTGSDFAVELEGTGGAIVSFAEAPVATGSDGSGFRVGAALRARYWILDPIGLELTASYDYRSVGLTGAGSRTVFDGDPALIDAQVLTEALDVVLGVTAAF